MNRILAIGGFPPKNDYLWVTWSIGLACNYSCRYCHVKDKGIASDITIENTMNLLRNAPQKIKDVTLFGGEPTLHPRIYDILSELSFVRNRYVFTNLSLSENELMKYKDVLFCVSFHPDIVTADEFLGKLEIVKNFINFLNVMMVYGKDEENEKVCQYCRDNKIKHRLLPIYQESGRSDWIKSISYSYRNDVIPIRDTQVMKDKRSVYSEQECISFGYTSFKNYYCYAGKRNLFIAHTGDVYRCQTEMRNNRILLNVNNEYNYVPDYIVCPYDSCSCEYYIPKEVYLGAADEYLF